VLSRRTPSKVIAVYAVKRVTRIQIAGKTRNAPLSTRAPTSIPTVVDIIPVWSVDTATKRVPKRKHVSKKTRSGQ
jgi:hypothetical protein